MTKYTEEKLKEKAEEIAYDNLKLDNSNLSSEGTRICEKLLQLAQTIKEK